MGFSPGDLCQKMGVIGILRLPQTFFPMEVCVKKSGEPPVKKSSSGVRFVPVVPYFSAKSPTPTEGFGGDMKSPRVHRGSDSLRGGNRDGPSSKVTPSHRPGRPRGFRARVSPLRARIHGAQRDGRPRSSRARPGAAGLRTPARGRRERATAATRMRGPVGPAGGASEGPPSRDRPGLLTRSGRSRRRVGGRVVEGRGEAVPRFFRSPDPAPARTGSGVSPGSPGRGDDG